MQNKKWFQNHFWIIALLILFFPVGLFLMWKYANWKPKTKLIITGIFAVLIILSQISGGNKSSGKPQVNQVADNKQVEQSNVTATNALLNVQPTSLPSQPSQVSNTTVKVTKVIDGDTVQVSIGGKTETIRIIGINTPETVDPRKPVECFGKEASNKAQQLLSGKEVTLEADPTQGERDKYNRLLRYVWTDNKTIDFGKVMIAAGFAYEYTYNTPYKYQSEYKQAQKDAETGKKGLWADNVCTGQSTSGSTSNNAAINNPPANNPPANPVNNSGSFSCGSKKYCTQMVSCEEARFYLNNCGLSRLDGDSDGTPCETLCR